jgi:hypothetical protein
VKQLYTNKTWFEKLFDYLPLPPFYGILLASIGVYTLGFILSLITENVSAYLHDFPWLIYTIYIFILAEGLYFLLQRYRTGLSSMKPIIYESDEEKILEIIMKFNKRLTSIPESIPFYCIFIPLNSWIALNRLWWNDYNNVVVFDVFSWTNFIIMMLLTGVALYTGTASIFNHYELSKKIPLNYEYLLHDKFAFINKYFGRTSIQMAFLSLTCSIIGNIPILHYATTLGTLSNFIMVIRDNAVFHFSSTILS